MSQVKHAEFIRAALDGKAIQYQVGTTGEWRNIATSEEMIMYAIRYPGWTFRLKPETVTLHAAVIPSSGGPHLVGQSTAAKAAETARELNGRVLHLVMDPDTFELISSQVDAA